MIQQTSREAYLKIQFTLNLKQWDVLEVLGALGTANDRELAKKLRWSRNCVTPRRGELVEKGLIKEAFKDKDLVTNVTTIYWTLTRKGIKALQQ